MYRAQRQKRTKCLDVEKQKNMNTSCRGTKVAEMMPLGFEKEAKYTVSLKQDLLGVINKGINTFKEGQGIVPLKSHLEVAVAESSSEDESISCDDTEKGLRGESDDEKCSEIISSRSGTESDDDWKRVIVGGESEIEKPDHLTYSSSPLESSDEKKESEDGDCEEILLTNWKKTNTVNDDALCLDLESEPWDTNASYKYTKVKKKENEVDIKVWCHAVGNREGRYKKKGEHRKMKEDTLRKYISMSRKERGVWQILKNKRRRLYSGKEFDPQKTAKGSTSDDECEKCDDFWGEDEEEVYEDEYEGDSVSYDLRKCAKRSEICEWYDPSMDDQLLKDMEADLVTSLKRMEDEKQRRRAEGTESSPCLSNEPELMTSLQNEDEDEDKEMLAAGGGVSRTQTTEDEQYFTRKDRGRLYKLEEELEDCKLEEWFDKKVREERRCKYLQNYKMAGLAQACINFDQLGVYFDECHAGEGSVVLEPRHFVLPYKMTEHPWVEEGITYEEFEKREKEQAEAAYAKWAVKSEYEITMALVKRLGRRYEKMFVERLKEAMTKCWEETDKLVLADWLRVCPLLMLRKNAKKTRLHALPQFHKSDMNVLFKCWLEIGPLEDVLLLHHRICQWICMLDDPTWCVREVINYMKDLKYIKRRRVNRISSPQHQPIRNSVEYVNEDYERDLWLKLFFDMYIRGRENNLKLFTIPESNDSKIRELLPCDWLDKVKEYVEPVVGQLALFKSFLKGANRTCELWSPCIRDSSSSDSDSENKNVGSETGQQENERHIDDDECASDNEGSAEDGEERISRNNEQSVKRPQDEGETSVPRTPY